jgi:hypothetical protein
MPTISATDLARNTREILNQIASHGETMDVERNHVVVARIIPSEPTMTAAQAFAGLSLPILTPKQATAWLKDSKSKFSETVNDPWA